MSYEVKEREWVEFQVKSEDFEYPFIDMKLSFDSKELLIRAIIHDTHFKNGERSWRYGDGFIFNFITQTYPDNQESERFYSYGFSIQYGEPLSTLVNHNGVYYLTPMNQKGLIPEITVETDKNRASYAITLPWEFLKPFHPLIDRNHGLNVRYTSQSDDGTTNKLFLTEDDHYDSETKVAKQYISLNFSPSTKSEIQLAFKLENYFVVTEKTKTTSIIYSPIEKEVNLSIKLKDQKNNILDTKEMNISLKCGINTIEDTIETEDLTGIYTVEIMMDTIQVWNQKFYRLSSREIKTLEGYIRNFKHKSQKAHEISSYLGMKYRLEELNDRINHYNPRDFPSQIKQLIDELNKLIMQCKRHNHYYTKPGFIRTAFQSKDDQTLQPYSLVLPKDFDVKKDYTLFLCFHGSGVDEVGFLKFFGLAFTDYTNIILSGPRGRDLSDFYIGQTENDVRDMIENLKHMFNITKTIALGFSMGGYGAWRLTFLFPHLFDGAIIVSGAPIWDEIPGSDVRPFRKDAKHIPYLVMHGTEDKAVSFKITQEFVDILNEEGFDITFKAVEGAGHADFKSKETIDNWLEKYRSEVGT